MNAEFCGDSKQGTKGEDSKRSRLRKKCVSDWLKHQSHLQGTGMDTPATPPLLSYLVTWIQTKEAILPSKLN